MLDLKKHVLEYAPLLEILHHNQYEILWQSDHSLVVHDYLSGIYCATCEIKEEAQLVLSYIPDEIEEVLLFKKYLFEEKLKHGILPSMVSYNTVYLKNKPLPVKLPKYYMIDNLKQSHVDFVMNHYSIKELCIKEHIQDRIKAGMLGVFYKGQIVGFIGTHNEGGIGMLEVLPEHRHLGLGLALQNAMCNTLLKQGNYIYGQVTQNNVASFHLQNKSQFTLCDEANFWYFK